MALWGMMKNVNKGAAKITVFKIRFDILPRMGVDNVFDSLLFMFNIQISLLLVL